MPRKNSQNSTGVDSCHQIRYASKRRIAPSPALTKAPQHCWRNQPQISRRQWFALTTPLGRQLILPYS
uniref:Uncharacterized protein n=1 Tax=Planktothricoides sp. SpSt-374 TaxID=2282167 RepID=A0A7C3VRX1_9CYAN